MCNMHTFLTDYSLGRKDYILGPERVGVRSLGVGVGVTLQMHIIVLRSLYQGDERRRSEDPLLSLA